MTDGLDGLSRFFRIVVGDPGVHVLENPGGPGLTALHLRDLALGIFRDSGHGLDTVSRFLFDLPEPLEAQVADHDGDDGQESDHNDEADEPPVGGVLPLMQKPASELVETALDTACARGRDRRLGGRIGLHGGAVIPAVPVACWAGVGGRRLGRGRRAFNGGGDRLRGPNHGKGGRHCGGG